VDYLFLTILLSFSVCPGNYLYFCETFKSVCIVDCSGFRVWYRTLSLVPIAIGVSSGNWFFDWIDEQSEGSVENIHCLIVIKQSTGSQDKNTQYMRE